MVKKLYPYLPKIEYGIFYDDHDERYAHIPPRVRDDYPDEVKVEGVPIIKREKTLDEMTPEERKRRKGYVIFFAKDIPLSRAFPKEFK